MGSAAGTGVGAGAVSGVRPVEGAVAPAASDSSADTDPRTISIYTCIYSEIFWVRQFGVKIQYL